MDPITIILTVITIASALGAASAVFYSVRQGTIITVLKQSNEAYLERNTQLETENKRMRVDYTKQISLLEGRIGTLERIKTPPIEPLYKLIDQNHKEVMAILKPEAQDG